MFLLETGIHGRRVSIDNKSSSSVSNLAISMNTYIPDRNGPDRNGQAFKKYNVRGPSKNRHRRVSIENDQNNRSMMANDSLIPSERETHSAIKKKRKNYQPYSAHHHYM